MNQNTHTAECLAGFHSECDCENACACACHAPIDDDRRQQEIEFDDLLDN